MSGAADRTPVFDRAAEFVSEMWSHSGPGSEMHVGDLVWGTFHRWPSAVEAVRLWPDSVGQTQVLTMFDGSGVCDLVVRPGPAGLEAAARALEWAERASAATVVGSEPFELRVGRRLQSTEVVELLRARGFERRSIGVPAMSRTIADADVASPTIPRGYAIRELLPDDLASRVQCFEAAFPGRELCVDAYRALRACPTYVPRLDVVATSPSSEVAAFATMWLDPYNGVVQIEPAGCHPDHRRLGLTRAVILEALRESVELGASGALVRHVSTNTAAHALYASCGFTTSCEHNGFVKTIPRADFDR
ncbi:GNAT family N-acetyltransferase [Ilumatobacter sp.]|uniref:GNAT family N-acetyltransferase n=1 Tax=Ilumatobacter sp. TaxID=1967498 RepID=UPI003C337076